MIYNNINSHSTYNKYHLYEAIKYTIVEFIIPCLKGADIIDS